MFVSVDEMILFMNKMPSSAMVIFSMVFEGFYLKIDKMFQRRKCQGV